MYFFVCLGNDLWFVSQFWTIIFSWKCKNIYKVVLALLRCWLRATQNSISVQAALHFVTKLMVPKHKISPISWLLRTCSNVKISLPLAIIITPITAFSMLCQPHNYSILLQFGKGKCSFCSEVDYGNAKSLTKLLEFLCKQCYLL